MVTTILLLPFHGPRLCAHRPCNAFVAVSPWLAFVVATHAMVSCCSMAHGTFAFATPLSTLSSSDHGNPAAYLRSYPCPVFQLHDSCMPCNHRHIAFESGTLLRCNFWCSVQHHATPAMKRHRVQLVRRVAQEPLVWGSKPLRC
jgi:hypothetical protein